MSHVDEMKRQLAWRAWPTVLDALPPIDGKLVRELSFRGPALPEVVLAWRARLNA